MTKLQTWNGQEINDGINYLATFPYSHSLNGAELQMVPLANAAPIVGGKTTPAYQLPPLYILIENEANLSALRQQLHKWFNPKDKNSYPLVKADDDGGRPRYIMASVQAIEQFPGTGGRGFSITLKVDGDTGWRRTTTDTHVWLPTASGQTTTINNPGTDVALPTISYKATTAKSSGSASNATFVIFRWLSNQSAASYPVDLTSAGWNTSALIGANDMQPDGRDIRLSVGGVDTDYWLDNINSASTKVWANMTFSPSQTTVLSGDLGTGSLNEILTTGNISGFPSSGLLSIDNEVFTYTGKTSNRFTGVTRASKGSSPAAHVNGTTIYWLQYEIWLTYGDDTLAAKTVDDAYKPIFSLPLSSNTLWVYQDFYESGKARAGAWQFVPIINVLSYGGNQATSANPFSELGIEEDGTVDPYLSTQGYWFLNNPCGIASVNFTNGEIYLNANPLNLVATIDSSANGTTWSANYTIPTPGSYTTWTPWSQNVTLVSGAKYVRMFLDTVTTGDNRVEVADASVSLNSTNTPTSDVIVGISGDSYSIKATFTNEETGHDLNVDFSMDLNETLQINTDERTVTYLADGSDQYQAIDYVPREYIFALLPGNNVIRIIEENLVGAEIIFSFESRDLN